MIPRLFWLGVIETRRPELSPRFFQVDWAPPILRFLCRPESACCVSWMKGADIIVRTVCPWLLSALLLLTNAKHLLAMLDAKQNHEHSSDIPAYIIKDRLTASALAFSTSICIFCVQCVWVIWPRLFRGERHSSISKIVANEGRMLVDPRHPRLGLPFINIVFWLPYYLYVVRITV